jgi:AbrB family looped-hinge helix DNA binding protein
MSTAAYFDPTTGRYESSDPLGLAADDDPHRYVYNTLTWSDPYGLAPGYKKVEVFERYGSRAERDSSTDRWGSACRAAVCPPEPTASVDGSWELTGSIFPMEATVDAVGRIVVPKPLRDALGLEPGTSVDVSLYGAGLHLVPAGRTARLREIDGALVAESDTIVTDETVFALIDAGRR